MCQTSKDLKTFFVFSAFHIQLESELFDITKSKIEYVTKMNHNKDNLVRPAESFKDELAFYFRF